MRHLTLLKILLLLSSASIKANSIPAMSLSDFLSNNADFSRLKNEEGVFSFFELFDLPDSYLTSLKLFRSGAMNCIKDDTELEMADGSLRRTAAKMGDGSFGPCLHLDPVLEVFNEVQAQVIKMIEMVSGEQNLNFISQGVKMNLEEVLTNKDHAHVYFKDESKGLGYDNDDIDQMVPWHVDNGLFLILTSFPDHPLLLQSSSKNEAQSALKGESILVLFGSAMNEWLFKENEVNNKIFRAAIHAVPALYSESEYRAVLARMAVAPFDAISSDKNDSLSFGEAFLRRKEDGHSNEKLCMNSDRYAMEMDAFMTRACDEGTEMCWMMCLELDTGCNAEENICLNEDGLECRPDGGPEGVDHDITCAWQCRAQPTPGPASPEPTPEAPSKPNYEDKYCIGGTDMLMGGFETQFATPPRICLILFIDIFTLDTPLKFTAGCIAVFFLGLLIEALVMIRRTKCSTHNLGVKLVALLCFALNLTLGYLAMLVAMTYSVELFASVVLGLAVGHLIFNLGGAEVGENVDPCCVEPAKKNTNNGTTDNLYQSNATPKCH